MPFSFRPNPMKFAMKHLSDHCPDRETWNHIHPYLLRGRRPADPEARAAIRAYLELRERLGQNAAFKAGVCLDHGCLAPVCREHCRLVHTSGARPGSRTEHWARFLLAADYILSEAYVAGKSEKRGRAKAMARIKRLVAAARRDYLGPLQKEMNGAARQARPEPQEKSAAALALEQAA